MNKIQKCLCWTEGLTETADCPGESKHRTSWVSKAIISSDLVIFYLECVLISTPRASSSIFPIASRWKKEDKKKRNEKERKTHEKKLMKEIVFNGIVSWK